MPSEFPQFGLSPSQGAAYISDLSAAAELELDYPASQIQSVLYGVFDQLYTGFLPSEFEEIYYGLNPKPGEQPRGGLVTPQGKLVEEDIFPAELVQKYEPILKRRARSWLRERDTDISAPSVISSNFEQVGIEELQGAGDSEEGGRKERANEERFNYSAINYRPYGRYGLVQWSEVPDLDRPEEDATNWVSRQEFSAYEGQHIDEDPKSPSFGQWVTEEGGEAAFWQALRRTGIDESIRETPRYVEGGPSRYLPNEVGIEGSLLRQSVFERRPRGAEYGPGRPDSRFRDEAGRFTSGERAGLEQEALEDLEAMLRRMLLENYDWLIGKGHGGDQTGALRGALSNSRLLTQENKAGKISFSMPLPNEPGIQRPGFTKPRPGTVEYGNYVFQGRPAIMPGKRLVAKDVATKSGKVAYRAVTGFLRFRMHGEMITTKNVVASRTDLNIYDLTQEQRQELAQRLGGNIRITVGGKP